MTRQVETKIKVSKKTKKNIQWDKINRFVPDLQNGLTQCQVDERFRLALINQLTEKRGKSIFEIFTSNIFTFFNLIYIVLAIILIIYGQWTQINFLLVAFCNTSIAIIQEIRSKKSLDKLRLVNSPKATVIRDGVTKKINANEVVLDDILLFSTGGSICVDSIVLEGYVEVNESILTGESDSVVKNVGDTLFAGSYVTAGSCIARADKVAEYNYIENLTQKATKYQKPRSEMLKSLKWLLKAIAFIMVPIAIIMWFTNYDSAMAQYELGNLTKHQAFIDALNKTAGSIIGMIPAGAFLLTTIALAVSVLKLAQKRTMVQELYCIEMLARVDVLCLDKTGTLTDGTMNVVDFVEFDKTVSIQDVIGSINFALNDQNLTSIALKNHFGSKAVFDASTVVPFSSKRKFSAVSFDGRGTYFLGAPEFVLQTKDQKVGQLVQQYAGQGYRVLLLAHSPNMIGVNKEEYVLPVDRLPIALIAIEDGIRPDAKDTIKWFGDNDVDIKIITGDNPLTASFIAQKVGVPNSDKYVTLEGMTDEEISSIVSEYSIFGRVTPEQKAVIVKALRDNGKTVAMTGDGVNDILAMRESDCSIAMGSGSDAALNASHLVLLDNNFSNMPNVVTEGRQVVNNIQSASSMYFMKTVFTILLNFVVIMANYLFGMTVSYPFTAANIMLLELAVIGLPTVILALQPNKDIIRGEFLKNALKRSLPPGLTYVISVVALYFICQNAQSLFGVEISSSAYSTISALVVTFSALFALYFACRPLNKLRVCVLVVSFLAVCIGTFVPFMSKFFGYENLVGVEIILVFAGIAISCLIMFGLIQVFNRSKRCKKQSL